MYIVAWVNQHNQEFWEIVDGEDAMQIRVDELIELYGDDRIVVGKVLE